MIDSEANGSAVRSFTTLLGEDVYFVPCEYGTKQPLVTYVERPFEDTKSAAYLASFEAQQTNIAVYLGRASGGLCAIDFDVDEDLAEFRELNPALANTTLSRGSRGGMLWLRIAGPYPESCNPGHRHFEWRADKRLSIIYGRHPKGMDYSLVVEAPPVTIAFSDIHWPQTWELPWNKEADADLRHRYGEPYYLCGSGSIAAINEAYWAGLFASETTILYERDEADFYEYDVKTGLYGKVSEEQILTRIAARMLEASRQANAFDLQKKRSASTLKGIIAHLRGIVEEVGPFAQRRRIIHVANGVIVLEGDDFELRPHSPEFKSRNRSPIVFDVNASCNRFLDELVRPAVHPDDIELLQKFAGMMLLGYNRAQRILILDGEGGRGKTQFANVMQGLIGMDNVTQLRTKHLSERFELYRYLKRTLLVGVDVEPDFLRTKGAGVLKGLVGGDYFDAEQKGGTGSFQMQGTFNVLITSNSRLRVRLQGDVSAWKRRLNIVRYEAPEPVRKIPDFGNCLLRTEGSGILNWALLGASKVLAEIPDEGGDFSLTAHQHWIVDSLLAESDSLRHFLHDRVVSEDPGNVTTKELVEAYAAYCPRRGWPPLPITEIEGKLRALMLELFGVTESHSVARSGKGTRGYYRVLLKEATDGA